jgi:hypothetical protein
VCDAALFPLDCLCRWAEAMAAQGSGGAYEISQRMTAMVSGRAEHASSQRSLRTSLLILCCEHILLV